MEKQIEGGKKVIKKKDRKCKKKKKCSWLILWQAIFAFLMFTFIVDCGRSAQWTVNIELVRRGNNLIDQNFREKVVLKD